MDTILQPNPIEELHDEFQMADFTPKPYLEKLWYGGRKASVIRMLSLREILAHVEVRWEGRAEQELGDYIMAHMTERPALSAHGRDISQLCSEMMRLEALGFPRYLREGSPNDDDATILGRIRNESSELHILIYLKMFEHLALTSADERVWRPAMMLMSDINTLGNDPARQEIAALCLERIMMVEGQKCGLVARSGTENPSEFGTLPYPVDGQSGIVPAFEAKKLACHPGAGQTEAEKRIHTEKFDFARSCISESMFLVSPKVQLMNVGALSVGQYRNAIGPMLALCLGIRLRNEDPDKTPTGYEQSQLRSLLLAHLSQAYPVAGGDSDTLPSIAEHLQRTSLLLMDPSRTIASYSLNSPLSEPALAFAHSEMSKLLDPKQVLHPHPAYLYDPASGTLTPRFPHGGLQQSALVSTTELALNGFKPAASTLLQAMLELTGRFVPFTLVREKPPRQVREALSLMELCIESLSLAGIPGARAIPHLFIRGDIRISELPEDQIAELAVPALEILRIQSSTLGIGARFPSLLASRVVKMDVEIRASGAGTRPTEALRETMRLRNAAFGNTWSSFDLPDTSMLKPFLRMLDERSFERKRPSPPESAREPVFLLTKLKGR